MKYFLLKGHHNIQNIKEVGNKTYAVTDTGVFKIRENMHSNSFIIQHGENHYNQISQIYELASIDLMEIYNKIPFSSIYNPSGFSLQGVLDRDTCRQFSNQFFVLEKDFKIYKFKYEEVVKTLKYLQSIDSGSEFQLFSMLENDWKQCLIRWTTDVLQNNAFGVSISILLGFFILLDTLENKSLESFISEWKRADLEEIDIKSLISFMDKTFLEKSQKTKVKQYLSRLV